MITKKIKIGRKTIQAMSLKLGDKTLIVLRGNKGYVMCGYLNLAAANEFKDVAVKITGISTIQQALEAKVVDLTKPAKELGIFKGQPIKDVLKAIV